LYTRKFLLSGLTKYRNEENIMNSLQITGSHLTIEEVIQVARQGRCVEIHPNAKENILSSRKLVEDFVSRKETVYGITTGFGKFSEIPISKEELTLLQRNLILSHATGVGNTLPVHIARAVVLLRINTLCKGYSGIRYEVLERMIYFLNHEITPLIPEQGSLGASGDLAPLAHMVLPFLGEGDCMYKGEIRPSLEVHKQLGLEPIVLQAKEGLALINGTPVMSAIGLFVYEEARTLFDQSQLVYGITMEALEGIIDVFDERLHILRPHRGQIRVADMMRKILKGSKNTTRQGEIRVQDAYSLRCAPQVHGATWDALETVREKLEIEINAVTDNPIIFPEDQAAISGGNFHGQPMALAFDYLCIAISEMANISERRIERLVNPALSGLPAFLTKHGGLHSGFMIAQYTAAALVSENKVLSHPASVDSIPSSANQEDHVSMGTIAARNAWSILNNTRHVIAIEYLCAAQGVDLRKASDKMANTTRKAYDVLRIHVPTLDKDRILAIDIKKAEHILYENLI
jgi:histidine ammonia-lyase